MTDLTRELFVVLALAAATVTMHMLGLTGLTQLMRVHIERWRTPWLALDRLLAPLVMVTGLFGLHGLEVAAYALVFHVVRAVPDLEAALYLSLGAYSTAGWTGVELSRAWRVLAAFESLNGILLLGWSTAFLFQTLHRVLITEETHPLPEGALAEEPEALVEGAQDAAVEATPDVAQASAVPSPRPSGSGSGSP